MVHRGLDDELFRSPTLGVSMGQWVWPGAKVGGLGCIGGVGCVGGVGMTSLFCIGFETYSLPFDT